MDFKESPPSFLYILYKHKQYLRSILKFKDVNFASGGSGLLDNTGKIPFVRKLAPSFFSEINPILIPSPCFSF
jgi:hypothetical protein